MVLAVRTDLKMGKGKAAAQCCHAAVGAYQRAESQQMASIVAWESRGTAKVALKVPDEAEMMSLKDMAKAAGLVTYVVADAGRTQIEPGSLTVLAIGPGPVPIIDSVAGHLKLY